MLFGKFKPQMLDKWQTNPPTAAKFYKLRQNMTADELLQTADFAWEHDWPLSWLDALPNPTCEALLLDCWPAATPDKQKALLVAAVELLKKPASCPHVKALLKKLDDVHLLNQLLPCALSHAEAAKGSFAPELLYELLAPWREQTGRLLLIVLQDLSEPGKLLAVRLCGLLKPGCAADLLHNALLDPWENVRVLAAQTACILPGEILPEFLAPATTDRCDTVRTAACQTLGLYAGSAAIPTLRRLKAKDTSWAVKSMCTRYITQWETALTEQLYLDESELLLKDAENGEKEISNVSKIAAKIGDADDE